jgi:hypothetical protein
VLQRVCTRLPVAVPYVHSYAHLKRFRSATLPKCENSSSRSWCVAVVGTRAKKHSHPGGRTPGAATAGSLAACWVRPAVLQVPSAAGRGVVTSDTLAGERAGRGVARRSGVLVAVELVVLAPVGDVQAPCMQGTPIMHGRAGTARVRVGAGCRLESPESTICLHPSPHRPATAFPSRCRPRLPTPTVLWSSPRLSVPLRSRPRKLEVKLETFLISVALPMGAHCRAGAATGCG